VCSELKAVKCENVWQCYSRLETVDDKRQERHGVNCNH
jgi:hypothetical protein